VVQTVMKLNKPLHKSNQYLYPKPKKKIKLRAKRL